MSSITAAEKALYIARAKSLIESAASPGVGDSLEGITTRATVGMALLALAKVDD